MTVDSLNQVASGATEPTSAACNGVLCASPDAQIEPLRPKQFYLDTALAYHAAATAGTCDAVIAERADVHPRTVRWYRRIAQLPPGCHDLMRLYPRLFQATWAVQLVRRGPSVAHPNLLAEMQQMVTAGRTWVRKRSRPVRPTAPARPKMPVRNSTVTALRRRLEDPAAIELAAFSRSFLRLLHRGELIDSKTLEHIERALWV